MSKLLSDKTNNSEYSVGTIKGNLSVSPTGAATYTLPIILPAGWAGMTPSLALVYNSQAGDGIMGKGWMLSGVEYVGRIISTPYYNGYNGSVNFTDDQMILNGNKLIMIKDLGNNTQEYRDEIDDGSKVLSKPYAKNNNSKAANNYFVQYLKNGIIKEYGNSEDSRQRYGDDGIAAIRYYISKIYDRFGNSIEYHYLNNKELRKNGEIYIDKIGYTITAGKSKDNKYFTVQFNYKDNDTTFSKTSFFAYGTTNEYHFRISKTLSNIEVKYGDKTIKKYDLNYEANGILVS